MFARASNLPRTGRAGGEIALRAATVLFTTLLLAGCLAPDKLATPTLVPTLDIPVRAQATAEPATPTPANVAATSPLTVAQEATVAPAVFFVAPKDGATVTDPFDVEMGATGLTVEPAGEVHPGAGHMHILVDSNYITAGETIPKDEQHLHFGAGQLTTTLTLPPGEHTLRLQFADGEHHALAGDQYRDEIQITVK